MRRGVGLVELLVAMLVTMIIGGAATTLLRSGMEIDVRTVSGVLTQRSMGLPYLELLSVVEHAEALEILPAPPERSSLGSDKVLFLSAPEDDELGRSFLTLRTRDGDRRLPGFYNLSGVYFEKRTDAEREFVRLTLSADHNDREAVQTSDLYSLNIRTAIGGNENGPVLRIGGGAPVYALEWVAVKDAVSNKIITSPTVSVGDRLIGDYLLVDSEGTERRAKVNYRWMLTEQPAPYYGPTEKDQPPTPELQISQGLLDRHIYLEVEYDGIWKTSQSYLVVAAATPARISLTGDLMTEIEADLRDGTTRVLTQGRQAGVSIHHDSKYNMDYIRLKGSGVQNAFFTKELGEIYFGERDEEGKRPQDYCLENYTLWVVAKVVEGEGDGWGVLLNGNVNSPHLAPSSVGPEIEIRRSHNYGYMLQFDPGLGNAFVMRRMDGDREKNPRVFEGLESYWRGIRDGDPANDPRYHWADNFNERRVKHPAFGDMRGNLYATRITLLTKTAAPEDEHGKRRADLLFARVNIYDKPPIEDENGKLLPDSGANVSKTMWFGTDGISYWVFDREKEDAYALTEMPDVLSNRRIYKLGEMDNPPEDRLTADDSAHRFIFRIGRFVGMRGWRGSGDFEVRLYKLETCEGFPMDFDEFPWGKTVGESMGDWNPEEPYVGYLDKNP